MKNKTKIVIIISAVLLVLIFAACDSLIAPIKGRNNPNDAGSPTPAVVNLSSSLGYVDENTRQVELSWNEGIYEGDNNNLEGYIIVRKASSAPTTIWDCTVVEVVDSTWQSYGDQTVNLDDYPRGWRVYYAVFSYGGKWDDINEDDKLYLEHDNMLLKNTENYNIVGPVSTSVLVPKTFKPSEDGWVDFNNNKDMDSDTLQLWGTSNSYVGIEFDTTSISNVQSASLQLTTKSDNATTMGIEINLLTVGFSTSNFSNIATGIDNTYEILVQDDDIPSSIDETFEVDITDIVNAWVVGNVDNHGIRLRNLDTTMQYDFYSFDSINSPVLNIMHDE